MLIFFYLLIFILDSPNTSNGWVHFLKTINIVTSHNITIEYELASLGVRFVAGFIDLIIIAVYYLIVVWLFERIDTLLIIFFALISFYHFFFELYNGGQSPGKLLMKIKVVTLRGTAPTAFDYFLRWIFRLVDITFTLSSVGILSILTSQRSQRIGDILANTVVIQLSNSSTYLLSDIRASLNQEHEISFPAIVRYNDQEMLLVKQIIQRYRQQPDNPNIRELAEKMESKICDQLDTRNDKYSTISFLEKTLQDYIVLTR